MSIQVFKLPESMRIIGLQETKDQLTPLIESESDVSLDASDVSSLDTSGLQLILAARFSLEKPGRKLTVTNPSDALNQAITVSGADNILAIS